MTNFACPFQVEWEAEFAKYKSSPEYQKINRYASFLLHKACLQPLCHVVCAPLNCQSACHLYGACRSTTNV